MEFFIFLVAAMQMFVIPLRRLTNGQIVSMSGLGLMPVYGAYIIAASLYAIVYILKGIGLYIMAKKAGYKSLALFAFVPFLNILLIGKLCGKNKIKIMNIDISVVAIIAMILEFLYAASMAINTTALSLAISNGAMQIDGNSIVIADSVLSNMISITNIINYWVLSFVYSFASVLLYSVFLRRYTPRNAFLVVMLNIFIPIVWIFIFTCRNIKPISPEEYYREIRIQTTQYTTQNPNTYNTYANPQTPPPVDPFSEYSEKDRRTQDNLDPFGYSEERQTPQDPFEDYNDKNKGQE